MYVKDKLRRAIKVIFPDAHFISMLGWEVRLVVVHFVARFSPFERAKLRALKKRKDLKINVGNGPFKHDSWVNIDCRLSSDNHTLAFDLRRQWPIETGAAQFIFSEHVFEHFSYPDDILHILSECRRVLQKGGALRIVVPDAERYLKAYYEDDQTFLVSADRDLNLKMEAVNRVFRENGFHKYAYDYETLKHLLEQAGFDTIRRSSFKSSTFEELNLDLDEAERRAESLYVEAAN